MLGEGEAAIGDLAVGVVDCLQHKGERSEHLQISFIIII